MYLSTGDSVKKYFLVQGSNTSSNVSSGMGMGIDPITSGVQAASALVGAIANISDQNKRRLIESNLSLLTEKDQVRLAESIQKQKTATERTELIYTTVLQARNANLDRQQKSENLKFIIVGVAGLVTLSIVAWYLKR